MENHWSQERIQTYIDDQVEERLDLEYKAADALERSDGKKREITKDVSAMANSDGGTIIYGLAEYQEEDKKHLPKERDPIDQTRFSKEWLEQVINGIRPRMDGLIIHPVRLDSPPNTVVYVVEIPRSTTAHQAKDHRYYKRFNFEVRAMEDYEVRDVMNRATLPDVEVAFSSKVLEGNPECLRELGAKVINQGQNVVNHFGLEFTFPNVREIKPEWTRPGYGGQVNPIGQLVVQPKERGPRPVLCRPQARIYTVVYRSLDVLFPRSEEDVGQEIGLRYRIDERAWYDETLAETLSICWTLYADDMPPKHGNVPIRELEG